MAEKFNLKSVNQMGKSDKKKRSGMTFFLNGKVHPDLSPEEYQAIVNPKKKEAKK